HAIISRKSTEWVFILLENGVVIDCIPGESATLLFLMYTSTEPDIKVVNIFSGSMFVATLNSVPNTLISVPWADTIKGWWLLCCISKYASPFSVTLRSLPENEVGYVIFESEFNQTVRPSDKLSVEDVPIGELKVCYVLRPFGVA